MTAALPAGLVEESARGAVLRAHVQPGAAREGIAGFHGASLKVRVQAPATSGKANDALFRLLAKLLAVPVGSLSLAAGATSRAKRICFDALPADELRARLTLALRQQEASGAPPGG